MTTAPTIDKAAELAALRAGAQRVCKAADGRGVRWARAACAGLLVEAGHTPGDAQKMAHHTAVWAWRFEVFYRAAMAKFNLGRLS